jgi:hypothetical protein
MAAPSPDWFTGIYNFSPIDEVNQVWYDSFEIATYPFDAGTEKGDNFSPSNAAEDPQIPIFELTKETVPENGIFLNDSKTEVLPVALWTCELQGCIDSDQLKSKGKRKRNCNWVGRRRTRRRCNRNRKGKTLADHCPFTCGNCEVALRL